MKLLFDENISYRILKKLDSEFSDSITIRGKTDNEIWEYAKKNDFSIVTFDEDFYDIQTLRGAPPKIIWLRCGNSTTENIAILLNSQKKKILQFLEDETSGVLEIY